MKTVALVAVLVLLAACNQPSKHATPNTLHARLEGNIGGAAFEIDVPEAWNGTLFLWSHGYVAPGSSNPAQDAPTDQARTWLVQRHYALAGSSYSSTGWALEDAFNDQITLLDFFSSHVGKPKRVIAWGASLGGIITAGLVQLHPERFAAAMPLCGVLAGGIATWNSELDAAYAFKTLLAPQTSLQLVHVTDGAANVSLALSSLNAAQATPQGQARLALVAALIDLPGWFDPTRSEPAPNDYTTQAQQQILWESRTDFAFAFRYRTELEQRAGGNPSWNVGVDYSALLAESADRDEVVALYQQSGLDLNADLAALASGARIKPDPSAAAYLARYVSFNGELTIPVLSMHTTGDGLVVPPNENAYAGVVAAAGRQDLLRQVFVHRAGHCAFSPAETIAALQQLLHRLDTGRWDDVALKPNAMNAAALAQGPGLNSFFGFSLPPSFEDFAPSRFLRPFASGDTIPS